MTQELPNFRLITSAEVVGRETKANYHISEAQARYHIYTSEDSLYAYFDANQRVFEWARRGDGSLFQVNYTDSAPSSNSPLYEMIVQDGPNTYTVYGQVDGGEIARVVMNDQVRIDYGQGGVTENIELIGNTSPLSYGQQNQIDAIVAHVDQQIPRLNEYLDRIYLELEAGPMYFTEISIEGLQQDPNFTRLTFQETGIDTNQVITFGEDGQPIISVTDPYGRVLDQRELTPVDATSIESRINGINEEVLSGEAFDTGSLMTAHDPHVAGEDIPGGFSVSEGNYDLPPSIITKDPRPQSTGHEIEFWDFDLPPLPAIEDTYDLPGFSPESVEGVSTIFNDIASPIADLFQTIISSDATGLALAVAMVGLIVFWAGRETSKAIAAQKAPAPVIQPVFS